MANAVASKKIKSLIGLAVSLLLIGWVFYSVSWKEVGTALTEIKLVHLIPLAMVFFVHYSLRSWRWRFLLPKQDSAGNKLNYTFRSLWDSLMIGNLATYLLPLRAGEFIRPYVLTRSAAISYPSCLVSVVLERFFDLSMVLFSFALMVLYVPNVPTFAIQGAISLGILASLILVFILVGSLLPQRVLAIVDFFLKIVPQKFAVILRRFAVHLLEGAEVLRSPKDLLMSVVLSVIIWASCYYFYQLFFHCLGMPGSFEGGVIVGVLLALAVAAPSAPGFFGIYEVGCIAAFTILGLNKDQAVAYALVSHAFQYVFILAVGFISLLRQNLKFAQLKLAVS